MDFQVGQFRTYRATSRVHLGAIQQDLPENATIEFDGQTMRWGGKDYNVPALVGGITKGWLVPTSDNVSRYVAQPAGVKVRPAQSAGQERGLVMTMDEASEEEQVVGTLGASNSRRDIARQEGMYVKTAKAAVKVASEVPEEVSYPGVGDDDVVMDIVDQDVESDQDARPVTRLSDPKKKTVITDASAASKEIQRLDTTPHKPKAAARPKAPDVSGESITSVLPGGATGDVAEARSGEALADLLPHAASSGLPNASQISWDTARHWKERVKNAVDLYGNDQAAMQQVMAMESPTVVKYIRSELARRA